MDNEVLDMQVESAPTMPEKTFTADEVNRIAAKTRQEATERARRQFESEQAKMQADRQAQSIGQQSQMGGMQHVDVEKLKRDIYDQIMSQARDAQEQQAQEQHRAAMHEVAATYQQKMARGKELHGDFDEAMADFDPSSFPKLVLLASQLDNAASVMYELAKNPMKLASVDSLAEKSPQQALKALKSLGASIQQNQSALSQSVQPNAPLSRTRSSVAAGADSNEQSVAAFRRQPYLRG